AVMPPSLHPEGSRYRWHVGEMAGGEYSARPYDGEVPVVRELPVLPREWLEALLKKPSSLAADAVIEGVEPVRYPITREQAETKLRDALNAIRRAREGERNNRSEEHTSELQSRENLVCRLLLEKKKI